MYNFGSATLCGHIGGLRIWYRTLCNTVALPRFISSSQNDSFVAQVSAKRVSDGAADEGHGYLPLRRSDLLGRFPFLCFFVACPRDCRFSFSSLQAGSSFTVVESFFSIAASFFSFKSCLSCLKVSGWKSSPWKAIKQPSSVALRQSQLSAVYSKVLRSPFSRISVVLVQSRLRISSG